MSMQNLSKVRAVVKMAISPMTRRSLNIFEDPYFHHGLKPCLSLGNLRSDYHTTTIVPQTGDHNLMTGYRRTWAREASSGFGTHMKSLHIGSDGFQASVDVHHFEPSEITVKIAENRVVIEGSHEERDEALGSVQRHFIRRYTLPDDYDMTTLNAALSADGILTLKAPPPHVIASGERHVPIVYTNIPVHLSVEDKKAIDVKKDSKPDTKP